VKPAEPKKTAKKAAAPKAAEKASQAVSAKPAAAAGKRFSGKELDEFSHTLLAMRERLTGQIRSLKDESLTRNERTNIEEDGTDVFDRQFALTLMSTENNDVFEIDEALRRINDKNYGVCESCSELIEKPRLKALPFVRMCINCQSQLEKGRRKPAAPEPARRLEP
jgi:DnaK suppressor protein